MIDGFFSRLCAWHADCVDSRSMLRNWLEQAGQSLLRRGKPMLRVALSASALLFLMADDGIGPDEFQCEVAVAHLLDCCPALPSDKMSCSKGGCESKLVPDLAPERSMCLQSKSCEELIALGACDMANWEVPMAAECAPNCSTTTAKVPPCH